MVKQVMNSTADLRKFLIDQMTGVAEGSVPPNSAKAITNIAQQIYNTINIEIKMAIAKSKLGDEEIKTVDFNG